MILPIHSLRSKRQAPASVDWRKKGRVVTNIKDQGVCGSCWAFAAVAALESARAINGEDLDDFSEQQLLDCGGEVSSGLYFKDFSASVSSAPTVATAVGWRLAFSSLSPMA